MRQNKRQAARELVEVALNNAHNQGGNSESAFLWADSLDGIQSPKYRLRLNAPIQVFYIRQSGVFGGGEFGEVKQLEPGVYAKGPGYISDGAKILKEKSAPHYMCKLTDVAKSFLQMNAEEPFFPINPVGQGGTPHTMWALISDLRTNANELTRQKQFTYKSNRVLPNVKAKHQELLAAAEEILRPVAAGGWESASISAAFDDFTYAAEEIVPGIEDSGREMDTVNNWLEVNVFNAAAKKLGATDADLEV